MTDKTLEQRILLYSERLQKYADENAFEHNGKLQYYNEASVFKDVAETLKDIVAGIPLWGEE